MARYYIVQAFDPYEGWVELPANFSKRKKECDDWATEYAKKTGGVARTIYKPSGWFPPLPPVRKDPTPPVAQDLSEFDTEIYAAGNVVVNVSKKCLPHLRVLCAFEVWLKIAYDTKSSKWYRDLLDDIKTLFSTKPESISLFMSYYNLALLENPSNPFLSLLDDSYEMLCSQYG